MSVFRPNPLLPAARHVPPVESRAHKIALTAFQAPTDIRARRLLHAMSHALETETAREQKTAAPHA